MRIIVAILISSLIIAGAYAQTFLGNCSGGTVTVQVFNGNVYCTSSSCVNSLDYSQSCDSQYIPGVM
jgi:hypothetical protein